MLTVLQDGHIWEQYFHCRFISSSKLKIAGNRHKKNFHDKYISKSVSPGIRVPHLLSLFYKGFYITTDWCDMKDDCDLDMCICMMKHRSFQ